MDEPPSTLQILSIRATAKGRRLLTLSDGREFLFSGDAVERVGLAEGMEAAPELFEALEAAEQRTNAHEAALRLLAHRSRSEREMRMRLAMRGIEPAAIDEELERLRRAGLLDDEKFARAWVEDRKATAPRGRRMLRYELLGRGIAPEAVDSVTLDVDDRATAIELARKRSRTTAATSYDAFVSRVGGFLRRRGFDYAIASEATRIAWEEAQPGAHETTDD